MKQGGYPDKEPIVGDGFDIGKIQPVGGTLEYILPYFPNGLVLVVLKTEGAYKIPIVPVIHVQKIFPLVGVVKIEVMTEVGS